MDVPVERNVARPGTESDAALRGRQLGDFVLRECIGEGAFAAVYRSYQPVLGRDAVVKVLHHRLQASEVALQRFLREARLASRLDHPYAAHVYAFGVEPDDGVAWIAMELVHGTPLERWLRERGPLPLAMLVPFFEQVAEVVQNAHDHGIVHRDLKPSNVMMIEYAGRVIPKLLDFGIAKMVDDAAQAEAPGVPIEAEDEMLPAPHDSGNQHLTQANVTLGSPPYMSPEQWVDPLSVGPRSDLYSLAVMTYEALTGRQPFVGPTIAAIGEQHCNADIPPVGDGFPAALDRVFRRALAKQPEDRPASALAFASELRAAAFPRAATDRKPGPAPLFTSSRRAWLLGGAAVLTVIGTGVFLVASRPDHSFEPTMRASLVRTDEAIAPEAPRLDPISHAGSPVAQPATAPARVAVEIASRPRGATVFRLPSETMVGSTPWRAELPSEPGKQVFLVRLPGYVDRLVELDLRTGGKEQVTLQRVPRRTRRPPPPPPAQAPVRQKGEPVDPFGPLGPRPR